MLDTAIAYHAKLQDRQQVIKHSKTLQQAFNQGSESEARAYVAAVAENYRKLLERLGEREKLRVEQKRKVEQEVKSEPKPEPKPEIQPIQQQPQVKRRIRM